MESQPKTFSVGNHGFVDFATSSKDMLVENFIFCLVTGGKALFNAHIGQAILEWTK